MVYGFALNFKTNQVTNLFSLAFVLRYQYFYQYAIYDRLRRIRCFPKQYEYLLPYCQSQRPLLLFHRITQNDWCTNIGQQLP